MTRIVTLVLVDPAGRVLGALPPFEAALPWWQNVGEFARADRQVLRLLHGDRPAPPGGHVTYLAEVSDHRGDLYPVEVDLTPDPRRAAYAEVGGPAASLAWAREVLGGPAPAHQQRTWNLSAIWRIGDDAWLKQVPAFFAHEPAAIRLVDEVVPGLVPELIADGPQGRMLLAHIEGEDRYGAGADVCDRIAAALHPVQVELAGRVPAVIPDGRLDAERIRRVAEPYFGRFDGLEELVDGLPARFSAVAECGLPDTLVHGDLHPGNVRTGPDGKLTIMDWGDCTIGHPAFDILRLTEGLDDPEPVVRQWAYRWVKSRPGAEPMRAAELLRPVAALRAAVTYSGFLDRIDPSEWPYHAADVPDRLAAALS
ncbi:aminoglycoside phosphotransferase family protein [Actinoplanes sp. NPDC026619]|uniref:phosphotransferase family protein n=1 Tax=Actinoplanes sp. NPDC026619 TaxID=3155798 RepID=UPI0033CC121D